MVISSIGLANLIAVAVNSHQHWCKLRGHRSEPLGRPNPYTRSTTSDCELQAAQTVAAVVNPSPARPRAAVTTLPPSAEQDTLPLPLPLP